MLLAFVLLQQLKRNHKSASFSLSLNVQDLVCLRNRASRYRTFLLFFGGWRTDLLDKFDHRRRRLQLVLSSLVFEKLFFCVGTSENFAFGVVPAEFLQIAVTLQVVENRVQFFGGVLGC